MAESSITDWLMLGITFIYVVATITFAWMRLALAENSEKSYTLCKFAYA